MSDLFQDVREAISRDPHLWHSLVEIDSERLSRGMGQPCPFGCGGSGNDRLHAAPSFKNDGSVRCRNEDRVFDAIDALVSAGKAVDKGDAARQLAELYGVRVEPPKPKKSDDYYIPKPASGTFSRTWLQSKGISEAAFIAAGGTQIKYGGDVYDALPGYDPASDFSEPCRWILFDRFGKMIKSQSGEVKTKCVPKNGPGTEASKALLGNLRNVKDAELIIKVEGPTDLLRLWDAIPPEKQDFVAIISNANGATENPTQEAIDLFEGKTVWVVGDADQPGVKGALKWSQALASKAKQVWNVMLPFPVTGTHGKDIRDYFDEGATYQDFTMLEKEIVQPKSESGPDKPKDEKPVFVSGADLFAAFSDDVLYGEPPPVWKVTENDDDSQAALNRFSIRPNQVIVLGGAPGAGKTAFIMQIVFEILVNNTEIRALFCNVEMKPEALLERILSCYSGVPLRDIIDRVRYDSTPAKLQEGLDKIARVIDRTAFIQSVYTIERIESAARQFDAQIVVIDYAQRVRLENERPGSQPKERINDIMDTARRMADAGKCVVVVSALTRQNGKGKSYDDAGLDSFRESSELEYGTDSAYILTKLPDDYAEVERTTIPDITKARLLRCVKKRSGELKHIPLYFDGRHQLFEPLSEESAVTELSTFDGQSAAAGEGHYEQGEFL